MTSVLLMSLIPLLQRMLEELGFLVPVHATKSVLIRTQEITVLGFVITW